MPSEVSGRNSPVTVSASSASSPTSSAASSRSPSPAAPGPPAAPPVNRPFSDDATFELPADAAEMTPDPAPFLSRLGVGAADSRVTVLAVFGKSARSGSGADKARIVRETTQKEVFAAKTGPGRGSSAPWLSCYHDARSNRVFLHFVNQFTDASELLRQWEGARAELEADSGGGGFLSLFSSRAFAFARALLFIFHAAHLVVLYHPSHTFDLAYLRLFKAVDAFRAKLQPILAEVLAESEAPFPREWIQHGRQTPPRLMVYFGTPPKGRSCMGETVACTALR